MTKKLRILLVAGPFPPLSIGGMAGGSFALYEGLKRLGYDIHILAFGNAKNDYQGVFRIGNSADGFVPKTYFAARKLSLESYDIIHIQDGNGVGLVPYLKKLKNRPKIITTLHVSILEEMRAIKSQRIEGKTIGRPSLDEYRVKFFNSPLLHLAKRICISISDRITAVSRATLNICVKDYNIPRDKISVVYNGIDTSVFYPDPMDTCVRDNYNLFGKKVFLFVGVLRRIRKGSYFLLHAFSKLIERDSSYRLIIVGEGSHSGKIRKLIKKINLTDYVIFIGKVKNRNLPSFYRAADALIVPSTYEGFPLVILEALACGTPVIASMIDGHREVIIDRVNGALFSIDSYESFLEVAQDQNRWTFKKKHPHNRKFATVFDWKTIIQSYHQLYQEVLS